MATDLGSLGSNGNKTAGNSLSFNIGQALQVGDIVVVQVATDNAANVNGVTTTHTSISLGTNTFVKVGEQTRGGGGAAAGVTLSVWRCQLTQAAASGAALQANFSFSPVAKGMSARAYRPAAGATLSYPTPVVGNNTGAPALVTLSGLDAGKEHILYRSGAAETKVASFTSATTDWTLGADVGSTGGGGDATHVSVMNEMRIATGTSFDSQPGGSSFDRATIAFAITETLPLEYIYKGNTARASRYLGNLTDAQLYLGAKGGIFPP